MVHTPEMSEKNLQIINAAFEDFFIDISWHNDLCDSVHNEESDISIYFPNSDVEDSSNEKFNTFNVRVGENTSENGECDEKVCATVEEVIAYVKTTEYFRLGEFIKKI